MTTLPVFLLARLDEDEAAAEAAMADPVATWTDQDWVELDDTALAHIARHDPARVLADVEAKRRIVALHGEAVEVGLPGEEDLHTGECRECRAPMPCDTLRLLALPYADHEDYREEWKP